MSDQNMQTIENATRADVRPGDHLTWKWVQEIDGVTVKSSHEGIAHHQDEYGDWWTEGGMWLTSGDAGTLTIRRPVQELPRKEGTLIVPADGREFIEAEVWGKTYYASEAILLGERDWLGAWRSPHSVQVNVTSGQITPGTWKVGNR